MPIKSKNDLKNKQRKFLNGQFHAENVRDVHTNQENQVDCVVASFFNREEVGALVGALKCQFVKVFLVMDDDGNLKMAMAGANYSDRESQTPTNSIYPTAAPFNGENGLLSEIDCPPRCQKDDSKKNNLVIVNKNLLGPIS